jgi:hypothetical protein
MSRQGRTDFISLLQEHKIEFAERHPPAGMIVAAGDAIELIGALGTPLFSAVAYVLGKWLLARRTRRVIITLHDRQILNLDAQGYSQDEVSKMLSQATSLTVIDTSKPEQAKRGFTDRVPSDG